MLFPCYKQRWEVAYNILESMLSEAGCNGQRGELDVGATVCCFPVTSSVGKWQTILERTLSEAGCNEQRGELDVGATVCCFPVTSSVGTWQLCPPYAIAFHDMSGSLLQAKLATLLVPITSSPLIWTRHSHNVQHLWTRCSRIVSFVEVLNK